MCSLFFTGDMEAVPLVEPDNARDGCKKGAFPLSTADADAGPSPRCSPHSSPPPPIVGVTAGLVVPTYDVMAAASAVWNPGSDVITFAIVSTCGGTTASRCCWYSAADVEPPCCCNCNCLPWTTMPLPLPALL